MTIKVPAQYASAPTSGVSRDVSSLADWWNNFQDSELQSLIKRAIVANLDVRIARAKLRESRATLRNTQTSNQIPTVDVDGSYNRSKTSQQNPQIRTGWLKHADPHDLRHLSGIFRRQL